MAAALHRRLAGWIVDHLLWDPGDASGSGFWRALWALRKVLAGVVLAAALTEREWVEHHPPEIVLIAGIHFLFVMAAIALLVLMWGGFRRSAGRRG